MYVNKLIATGYRNLNGEYPLCHPLSVIVGENNIGKSNIVDALRIVLEAEAGPWARAWLAPDDFAHDGHGHPVADQLELEVQLSDLDAGEQARMVTCLAPSLGAGFARIRLRAKLGADGRVITQYVGGDSDTADVERHARDAVRFTFLHPLRDANVDLRPGRDNRLIGLIAAIAPDGHADRQTIIDVATDANTAIDGIPAIKTAKDKVAGRLTRMTGTSRFAQETDLAFADPRFERVVGAMRAKIGRLEALEMTEGGLGYNNLLYMAVLLAALADKPADSGLRVLLVEEPEAHLHPQLQDLLMRFLEEEAGDGTQVIVTSHSPSFASVAKVERLTVVAREKDNGHPIARRPADFGLTEKQLAYLRRFLDVTKAALFFAKGVILVEGVAEQLLVPVIAQRLKRPLAPNGVAVINIGGVAFPPFTDLFGEDKLPHRLAVISDDDRQPDPEDLEGGEERLSPRAKDLEGKAGDNVHVALAPKTLEWALAQAGNRDVMLDALEQLKPRVAARLHKELADLDLTNPFNAALVGDKILAAVADVKGRYAQELAELIDNPEVDFAVPKYLEGAIAWVADEVEDE
jgi:putative ATP-dependent endonuclease of OLD family